MVTRILGNLIGLILGLCCLFGLSLPRECQLSLYPPVRDYTAQELESGLLGIELIYIKNYEDGCNYDVIGELSDDDVKYVTEKITQIHFMGYSPTSSKNVYGIKFCYKNDSLVFESRNIVRIDDSGKQVEGAQSFCISSADLANLIDELVAKYVG